MINKKIEIRKEIESDYADVYELNKAAFGQESESKLVELLRKSNAFIPEFSLVAVTNNKIVGHIIFTKIIIKDDNGNEFESLALAPMAVTPELQKRGIGGKLIRYGFNKARELGYKSVIVLGHEHYYPKFGFKPANKWKIKAPFDVPKNVFMGIELVENGLTGVTGTVHYPEEFEMI
ncbi:MAG: GNAT family N-acetyltransferase [Ignavibacteria bacterium RBG_16_34_14]|nr:MAG: GNAT family N-acetyltransferase [Ignavibacteria bacterium RBG_16_34_14]